MVKITIYTKAEIVEIQYAPDPTNYVYDRNADSKKLAWQLLRIIERNQEVEVITKEHRN